MADPVDGPQTSAEYRRDIDGLRAVAVISVLLYHCGVPGITGGFVGVDVFFVISGYLITGHLATQGRSGNIALAQFFERRARRIVPALIVTVVATWLASYSLLLPSFLINASRATVAIAFSVSNFYFWRTSNYFAAPSEFQPFLHTWSLSVEDQFYLTVPVIMAVLRRWLTDRWLLLFGPLVLSSFALSVALTETGPVANFFLFPTRAWELGIGAVIATARIPQIRKGITAEILGIAGLLFIIVPIFVFDDATPFPGLNALFPCAGTALLLFVGRPARPSASALLATPPLVGTGLISYSLYLVHWPIISLLHFRTMSPFAWPYIVAILFLSFGLAVAMWRFVEQPFRVRGNRITPRRVAYVTLAGVLVATCIGTSGIYAGGYPGRFPDFTEVPRVTLSAERHRCFEIGDDEYPEWVQNWSVEKCTLVATGPKKVLLWGDSFAAQFAAGIAANAREIDATVVQYNATGCPPVMSYRSYRRPNCTAFNRHALEIIRTGHFDTVIVSARWSDIVNRGLTQLLSTLKELDELGVDVLVVGQSPEFVADVQAIEFLHGNSGPHATNAWKIDISPSINETLAAVSGQHRFVNPMPALCHESVCIYEKDGELLFEDDGHLSAKGSTIVVDYIERQAPLVTHQ